MAIQKIKSGRVITVNSTSFVGEKGQIFYDENIGDLRLSDGITPGGIPLNTGGSGGSGGIGLFRICSLVDDACVSCCSVKSGHR